MENGHHIGSSSVKPSPDSGSHFESHPLAIGGALFGAFASGFMTELSTGHSKILLAVYVLLGLLGLVLIFAGLQD